LTRVSSTIKIMCFLDLGSQRWYNDHWPGIFAVGQTPAIGASLREGCGVCLAPKSMLADIKKDLESHVGAKIRLKANRGRRKIVEREGVLEGAYPNIFTIKIEEADKSERRVSYTYSDLLTAAVELVICPLGGQETKIAAHSR